MNSATRHTIIFIALTALMLLLAGINIFVGSVKIPAQEIINILLGGESSHPAWEIIILQSRLPMVATAILAGAALSVAGLLLQTVFNNPLAGPSILGVSTGASLGVAIVMLSVGTAIGTAMNGLGYAAVILGAFIGAMMVLGVILIFSTLVHSTTMLLIIGILVSYITSSAISLLNFFSTQEGVHSYVIWGLGSFSGVSPSQLIVLAGVTLAALFWAFTMVKPLNALLLGDNYAANLGVNIKRAHTVILTITGLLTAAVTAFCGPIGFIGLVVPHIARLLLNTSNHNTLLPATTICGATIALLCTLISVLPSTGILPINAITPIIGAPIILYIIVNRKKIAYFN